MLTEFNRLAPSFQAEVLEPALTKLGLTYESFKRGGGISSMTQESLLKFLDSLESAPRYQPLRLAEAFSLAQSGFEAPDSVKKIASQVELLGPATLLRKQIQSGMPFEKVKTELYEMCGKTLRDSSFYKVDSFSSGGRSVLAVSYCPFQLELSLRSLELSKSRDPSLLLSFVLGHEIGHHVESSTELGSVVAPLRKCVSESWIDDPIPGAGWTKLGADPDGQLSELVADSFGASTLVPRVRGLPRHRQIEILRDALGYYCHAPSSAVHMLGRLRVWAAVVNSEVLLEALGCLGEKRVIPPLPQGRWKRLTFDDAEYCGMEGKKTRLIDVFDPIR